jgi:hypothetical protein
VNPGGRLLWLVVCGALAACGRLGFDDAPTPDGGPDEPDAAIQRCASGEIVCGDFEEGFGGWSAKGDNGGLTRVEIVDQPVAVGNGALRIRTDVDGDSLVGAERRFAPIRDGLLYGRVLLWVSDRTSIADYLVAIQIDDGDDEGVDKLSIDILPYRGFVLTATTANPPVRPGSEPDLVTRDSWMCLTFEVALDEAVGSFRLYQEGALRVSADAIDTIPSPDGFTRFLVGAVQPVPAVGEVVFDGVALARQPLACP